MVLDKLLIVAAVNAIDALIGIMVHREVVAYATADKRFLHLRQGIDSVIDVEQSRVVVVEVGTRFRVQARRTHTAGTFFKVLSTHFVHISRWTAQVADITLKIVHLGHSTHFAENTLFTA